jgi:hypothetical protein
LRWVFGTDKCGEIYISSPSWAVCCCGLVFGRICDVVFGIKIVDKWFCFQKFNVFLCLNTIIGFREGQDVGCVEMIGFMFVVMEVIGG